MNENKWIKNQTQEVKEWTIKESKNKKEHLGEMTTTTEKKNLKAFYDAALSSSIR